MWCIIHGNHGLPYSETEGVEREPSADGDVRPTEPSVVGSLIYWPRGAAGGCLILIQQTTVICKTQGPLILTLQGNWGSLIALSDPSERRQALCIRSILPYFTGPFLAPVQRVPAYNINTPAGLK